MEKARRAVHMSRDIECIKVTHIPAEPEDRYIENKFACWNPIGGHVVGGQNALAI